MNGKVAERLTDDERAAFEADEAIIESGFVEFLKVGMALCRIRDSRLYRETHGTFESYVEKRWHLGRARANTTVAARLAEECKTVHGVTISLAAEVAS